MDITNSEHVSVHSTSLLRNVASNTGGAIFISNGTVVIINNITCVGNQGLNGGGCLNIQYVTLTLNNSDISENFGHYYAAGIVVVYSRIQVGEKLTNETRFMLINVNFYCKCLKCDSLLFIWNPHFQYNQGNFLISLTQSHVLSCKLRDFFRPRCMEHITLGKRRLALLDKLMSHN